MRVDPLVQEGYQLLHDGAIELARVEANGIRVDMEKLERTKLNLTKKIRYIQTELEKDKIWKVWRRRFGSKANLTSHKQLADVLHIDLQYDMEDTTESGNIATDEKALKKVDDPFVEDLLRLYQYKKALGTFLKGIEQEVVDGFLHPVFNLHTVVTYRSSSDSPNFQNFPVRIKEISKIIRSLFFARPKSLLLENDFKGIEVGVSACYHKDPNFISYITSAGKDMHRDMAAQIYCLDPSEVSKDARYGAKNKFVFPQFYGDFYIACAKNLWEWIDKGKLTTPDGKCLYKHLKEQGITKLGACDIEEEPEPGTFEKHLKEVEQDFWNVRFQKYGQWRKKWFSSYLEKGYFDLYTGFRIHGNFKRNQVTNFPIQGSAFHCLLWSLIQINRRLRKYKMKTLVVGQIHDSLISDVREDELKDYLELVEEVTTVELRKHYNWLIVPLEIEYEISPRGESWFDKREVKFKKGVFSHPDKPELKTTDPQKFLRALTNKEST